MYVHVVYFNWIDFSALTYVRYRRYIDYAGPCVGILPRGK